MLAFYGPRLREGVVQDVDTRHKQRGKPLYLVDFKGWAERWTQWVAEEHCLPKADAAAVELQKQIEACYGTESGAKARRSKKDANMVGRHVEKRFPDMMLYRGKVSTQWEKKEKQARRGATKEELYRVSVGLPEVFHRLSWTYAPCASDL